MLDLVLFGETGNYGAKSHASLPHYVGIDVFFFTLIVYLHVTMGLFDCVKANTPKQQSHCHPGFVSPAFFILTHTTSISNNR